ncbi:hypothetical protein CR513_50056, partial [Mucuna pruriens]
MSPLDKLATQGEFTRGSRTERPKVVKGDCLACYRTLVDLILSVLAKRGEPSSSSYFTYNQNPPISYILVRDRVCPTLLRQSALSQDRSGASLKFGTKSRPCGREDTSTPCKLNGCHGPRPTPIVVIHSYPQVELDTQEKWQQLEERLKAIKGVERYGFEAMDLCLVSDVIIPYKFKVPDFDK